MAQLDILHYPDSRLRIPAKPVAVVTPAVQQTVDNLLETMYKAQGIGLAATQANIQQRILVLDVSETRDQPMCLINPEITLLEGQQSSEEGCLSVPGIYDTVVRAEHIHVRALDREGQPIGLDAHGLLAICIQHELDHLDGKLFVDYLSNLKRQRIRKKLEKEQRQTVTRRHAAV